MARHRIRAKSFPEPEPPMVLTEHLLLVQRNSNFDLDILITGVCLWKL